MSMEQVSQIIGRALLDDGFREQLLKAPDQVLSEFDLSAQEFEALKQLNADQFQQLNEAFQAQLGGGEADLTQASNFLKIDGIDGKVILDHKEFIFKLTSLEPGAEEMIPGRLKWDPEENINFEKGWPSKIVPSSPAASTGLSLPAMLTIGAAVVVTVGAVAAGIFFFRGDDSPEEAGMDSQPAVQSTPGPSQEDAAIYEDVLFESSEDSMCLTGQHFNLCAVPAGQVVDQLGDTTEDPLMLPLTPEQASLLISASGGSPPGVTGFTVMMLAGPNTYQIKLPDADAGTEAIFLSDAQGNLYFGSAAYFPDETAFEEPEVSDVATGNSLAALAGTWESISGAGTMTCEGASITIPPAAPEQIVFDENGQAVLTEPDADSSTAEVTISSEGTFLATVTTVVDGDTIVGELEFALITPDLIEGTYRANYEDICTFERSVTMNRISGEGTTSPEMDGPLKPAEFSEESYFGSGDAFIPQLAICTGFPDVCKDAAAPTESLAALLSGWDTFDSGIFMHVG
ncbi:MAG: Os1348 family NHLP clan protein, partial [Anaerolineales bacterium]